ncbi:hypothetical protein J4212_06425 [Candidatus Woesearchaeota archaeon]|nr:hypothetical protein [Candidatus Woesearchaeota archaeon]
MQESFIRTIRKTGTSMGVNIPPEIIKLLSLKDGNIVRITIEKITKGGKD